ncbi:hypothetical protein C7B80_10165 [Cyanosarcina cf. burmensis CCALA 770]|nr:hypothetical protein C7B80_10165 [Cyanosarcina cf. burmensis CCALA 770]
MIVRPDSAAFPYLDGEGGQLEIAEVGLTKRELFAAMALQGMLANPATDGMTSDYVVNAVDFADALIERLNHRE